MALCGTVSADAWEWHHATPTMAHGPIDFLHMIHLDSERAIEDRCMVCVAPIGSARSRAACIFALSLRLVDCPDAASTAFSICKLAKTHQIEARKHTHAPIKHC